MPSRRRSSCWVRSPARAGAVRQRDPRTGNALVVIGLGRQSLRRWRVAARWRIALGSTSRWRRSGRGRPATLADDLRVRRMARGSAAAPRRADPLVADGKVWQNYSVRPFTRSGSTRPGLGFAARCRSSPYDGASAGSGGARIVPRQPSDVRNLEEASEVRARIVLPFPSAQGLLDFACQWWSACPEGVGVDAGDSTAAGSAVRAGPTTRALNR